MPRLTIDGITVEVPAGTSVLEAAKSVGIWIPHFCYHPALGSVGACRLCAVKLLDGPLKGIQMSCMLTAQDGMVVSTVDPEAVKMRSLVIEWLMLNHPHDCPVCDEGGECLLQDYTISGGHGSRRYAGKKRTHRNQELGPFIQHEMNRCIQCYRCARFYQEYAGGSDFGVLGSAGRVYFGRFADGDLESPFSGNLVDICPTGVFTDKTTRFRARYWDYELAPSICPWCSLGCATVPAARQRELLKIMARRNDAVNGWFLCDRGRFANTPVNDPARPRTPRVDGREVAWDEALDTLRERLLEVVEIYGAGSVAVVGSPRLCLEGNLLAADLARLLEAGFLCYFPDEVSHDRCLAAVSILAAGKTASLADLRQADLVAVVECDPLAEGPLLALAVRQAWRTGARVFLVGAGAAGEWPTALAIEATRVATLAGVPLAEARRPVVVASTGSATPARLAELAGQGGQLAILLPGPNAFGAALLAREHGAVPLAEALASGRVRAVVAIEADLAPELLAAVPLLAVADWQPTGLVQSAHLVLPTTAWVESDGTFINFEGRAQRFRRVMAPGYPLKGLPERYYGSTAKPAPLHPPHLHRQEPPGGDLRPAGQVMADLCIRLGGDTLEEPLSGRWANLRDLDPEGEGMLIS
jgi:NADH-quinone oxidoreductase subunit G